MTQSPSLTRRLLIFLLFAQACAFVVAWLVFIGLFSAGLIMDTDFTLNDLAFFPVTRHMEDSLILGRDGAVRVEPNASLRDRRILNPSFQFAVFPTMDRDALPGSSAALAESMRQHGGVILTDARFRLAGLTGAAARGSVEFKMTRFGAFYFVAAGYEYVWSDVFYALSNDWKFLTTYFSIAFGASAGVLFLGLRGGLAPLRRVAAETAQIDISFLSAGVSPTGVPLEIRPLIDAMNEALARVSASAARMRRYTANAAHELRTPIAILRARLQNPDEPTFRADIERDASQLQAIVEQILISARLGEGQVLARETVDLNEAVWAVVAAHMPLAIKCRRKIEFEATKSTSVVAGNRRAIESIVANLIDNAIRAAPVQSNIIVRIAPGPMVEVVDRGAGVDLTDRERIFEPFWRKHDQTSGTGLGLAIAKELMERLGGRIGVEETAGGGATFKLQFEVADR